MVTCRLGKRGFLGINFFAVALWWLMPGQGLAQQEEVAKAGKPTYEQSCAVCHGLVGKGDGGPPLY